MSDEGGVVQEMQEEEILALQSIYSEEEYLKLNNAEAAALLTGFGADTEAVTVDPSAVKVQDGSGKGVSGDFSSHLKLDSDFSVIDFQETERRTTVKFLPPIVLGFELPPDYPIKSAPRFVLSCKWLTPTQLSNLSSKLDELWRENSGDPILFIWFDFLQHEALSLLGIDNNLEIKAEEKSADVTPDSRVVQDIASISLLFDSLVEYNASMKQMEFERALWPCAVCFADKLGSECFKFNVCGHIYCGDCMTQHFTIRIEAGEVKQLTCPEDKCDTQAHPSQLKALLTPELFSRYEKLLLQSALDSMSDVTYCPRTFCQTALVLDEQSDMVTCSGCQFVFCKQCKLTYHGIQPCSIRREVLKGLLSEASEETVAEYKERYGKQFIEALERECASLAWMEKYCEPCPRCYAQITKIDGCNKMVCTRCKAYFCWLCKVILPRGNPYSHYRDGTGCKLFPMPEDPDIAFELGWVQFEDIAMEQFQQDL